MLVARVDSTLTAYQYLPVQVNAQITGLRSDIKQLPRLIETPLVNQLRPITVQAAATLTQANGLIADVRRQVNSVDVNKRIDAAQQSIDTALKPAVSIASQLDQSLPLFLDCEYNPDCVFNRFQGTSKAIEQMAQAGAKAAPEISVDIAGITKSSNDIAKSADTYVKNFTKPQTFWQKVKTFIVFGAAVGGKIL